MDPNLTEKQQNGHPRTWSDEWGCPELSLVTGTTDLALLQPPRSQITL